MPIERDVLHIEFNDKQTQEELIF